jgi:DNA polymerase-3 subunit alpha
VADLPEQEVNLVSSFIPKIFGNVVSLLGARDDSEKFKEWTDSFPRAFDIARKIEGLNKNTGVHPSGIAISFDKLEDFCPLMKNDDGTLISGYDMNWVAELMVKFDILGLRTLSVIQRVCDKLNLNIEEVDISSYSKIYQHLDELLTPHGLFQIEASANHRVCKKIQPKTLEELSAVIAIGRPGALDFLDSYVTYAQTKESQSVHSFFDDVLSYTGGIPLYQEQLMKMAVKVGFTLDESEQLRRIVAKKKIKEMPAWKLKIEQKVIENDLPHEVGEVLWKVAEDSANYSFNKSHSIAYATLAAWTAYLKFNHPQDFFIALLEMSKFEPAPHEEIRKVSHELHHFKINLLNPDLAKSKMGFKKEGKNIRFGLNSIKGISEKSLEALESFRDSDSTNKYDIFLSAKQAGLNIGVLSSLIQAGTLSDHNKKRSVLVLEAQTFNILTDREKRNVLALGEKFNYDVLKTISAAIKDELVGDDGRRLITEKRFITIKKKYNPYKEIYEKNKKYEQFANWFYENKLLGYSYSSELKNVFNSSAGLSGSQEFLKLKPNQSGRFIGVVEDSVKRTSRNGNEYVKVTLFDEKGSFDAMMSNNARYSKLQEYYDKGGKTPAKENIIVIYGKKGEDILFIDELSIIDKCIHMKLSDLK